MKLAGGAHAYVRSIVQCGTSGTVAYGLLGKRLNSLNANQTSTFSAWYTNVMQRRRGLGGFLMQEGAGISSS